jgi:hypothetical protein
MGISKDIAGWLMKEGLRRPFSGEVLTLGVQSISFAPVVLSQLAAQYRYPLRDAEVRLSAVGDGASRGYVSDRTFFEGLGFWRVSRTDFSTYEGAEVVLDLNAESMDPALIERFDVVIDAGTIEHVFHVPNVLKNLHTFVKPGGRIIHISPSSNHMDHGFYMFSPTFFYDYYATNGYEIGTFQVCRHTKTPERDPWWFTDYSPGHMDTLSYGGADNGELYATACVMTKAPGATAGRVPQQGTFTRSLWQSAPPAANPIAEAQEAFKRGDLEAGLRSCARLTELAPQDANIWRLYSSALRITGRTAEAAVAQARALELSPGT